MIRQKLKLGLILDAFEVPLWFSNSLERIAKSGHAQISLIILIDDVNSRGESGNGSEFVYKFFNRLDGKLFLRGDHALQSINLQKILMDIPVVRIHPFSDETTDSLLIETLEKIKGYELDILLTTKFDHAHERFVSTAKYGIWYYSHCDRRDAKGGPPGFWEAVEADPVTAASLIMVKGNPIHEKIIYRSKYLTFKYSPARNRNRLLWAASSFMPRQIELLYRLGESEFLREITRFNQENENHAKTRFLRPSNFEAFHSFGRLFIRQMDEVLHRIFFRDTWFLLFNFVDNFSFAIGDFKKIMPPKDRFWADPQVIQKDGKNYIFVEEFIYKNRKANLAVMELDSMGQIHPSIPILAEKYHLSYPFVFEHENRFYMVPESSENNSIDLYECVDFPTSWKFKMNLMRDIKAVDTTLFYDQGKWWLFTGITENEGALPEVELFLFYSDHLFTTEWTSHPLNPVVSDVESARPAGSLFIKDGILYRPSQNCSKRYGYGFNINEVQQLSPTEYSEKKVIGVKPDWDKRVSGTHTMTRGERFIMVDAFTRRSKFA